MRDLNRLKYPRLKAVQMGINGGIFKWRHRGKNFNIVASIGGDWDHVSVDASGDIPKWEEMQEIKEMFFYPDEVAVQYHPADSNYVNVAHDTLHLWRPQNAELPTPPIEFV